MDNLIVLRSVYGKVNQKFWISPSINPETGEFPSCVKRVDANGDMILTEKDKQSSTYFIPEDAIITVEDGTTFDMTKSRQRSEWEAIRYSELIVEDRGARDKNGKLLIDGDVDVDAIGNNKSRYGKAILYVERPGEISDARRDSKRLIFKAQQFIYEDSLDGMNTKCRLLGRDMRNAAASEIEMYLVELASKKPQKIIDLYTGSDQQLQLLFLDAQEKKVIANNNGVFQYGDITLGVTNEAVLTFLKMPANNKIRDLITKDTYPDYYKEEEKTTKKK